MTISGFSVRVDQNPYLPAGGRDVSAIVSVTADDPANASSAAPPDVLPDVFLRVWTPRTAAVKFITQVAPAVEDLTARGVAFGVRAVDYPTGAWAPGESRDYHVAVTVSPGSPAEEMLAARVSVVAASAEGEQALGQGLVLATWTDDEELSTRIDPRVAGYTGRTELAAAIAEGLQARRRGDVELATARLGRAVVLAYRADDEETVRLLASVVDVVDEATGTVRLKKRVDVDEIGLDTRSDQDQGSARQRRDAAAPFLLAPVGASHLLRPGAAAPR